LISGVTAEHASPQPQPGFLRFFSMDQSSATIVTVTIPSATMV
jgi:hypothetical protein